MSAYVVLTYFQVLARCDQPIHAETWILIDFVMFLPIFLCFIQLMVITNAFGPAGRSIIIKSKKVVTVPQRQIRSTTPTMVVYWSIKSAFDLGKYALGGSDKFKGTGVWSFIEFDKGGDKKEVSDESSESQTKSSTDKQKTNTNSK